MYIVRLIGGIIALAGAGIVSSVTGIEYPNVLAMIGFLLAVDSLIVRYIAALYMRHVMSAAPTQKQLDAVYKDKKDDDTSANGR